MKNSKKSGFLPPEDLVGLILAGGFAKRFGGGKCEAKLLGKPLICWVYEALNEIVPEIWLSLRPDQEKPAFLKFKGIIYDKNPGGGPTLALADFLKTKSKNTLVLVTSCDQPFLQKKLLLFLIEKAKESRALALCCVDEKERLLPFPGIYRGGQTLSGHSFKEALKRLTKTVFLPPSLWRPLDPEGLSFFNINTKQDLLRAQQSKL